ncbi:MAG: nucleotide exchange factor GrpE [Candidatus Thermoplasmatota archaeon]|nr:nucleotide exchange factor GrpE [Candidatus Thermoplasmatota archaeon]
MAMLSEEKAREPMAEIEEIPDGARIVVELPGVSQDGIKMEIQGKFLKIDAEGTRGPFSTMQALDFDPDPDRMSVTFSQGVLEILLPRKGAQITERPDMCENAPEDEDSVTLRSLQETLDSVNQKLETMSKERDQLLERVSILQKDFANLRKRHDEEKNVIADRRIQEIALSLIEVLDNFERARGTMQDSGKCKPGMEPFLKGVGMIESRINSVFSGLGIERIDSVGEPFDHNLHMAVDSVHLPDRKDMEIVEEKLSGYLYRGQVLRPSHVVVNREDRPEKKDGSKQRKVKRIKVE